MKKYLFSPKPGYLYVRKGGKYLGRITAEPGTEEFDRQYWQILTGKSFASKRSWKALIESYRRSDRWTHLKPSTRAFYEPVMTYVLEKNADRDMTKMQRKDVLAAMQANKHRSRFANAIPAVLSVICEHAIDLGWIRENPAKGIRKIKIPTDKQRPHIIPSDADVAAFRAKASPRSLLIFEIGVGTVQRPGDWVGFTWGDYDGETLALRQNKTDVPLKLPCTPLLKAALDRAKASLGAAPHPARRILTTLRGEPLTYNGLLQIMRKERTRLGMAKSFDQHGLRYRGVMELAWAGCDDDEIASFSGHTTKAMIIKYAGEARQVMSARQAAEKRQ